MPSIAIIVGFFSYTRYLNLRIYRYEGKNLKHIVFENWYLPMKFWLNLCVINLIKLNLFFLIVHCDIEKKRNQHTSQLPQNQLTGLDFGKQLPAWINSYLERNVSAVMTYDFDKLEIMVGSWYLMWIIYAYIIATYTWQMCYLTWLANPGKRMTRSALNTPPHPLIGRVGARK